MSGNIIFYNGFNLLVDIIIFAIAGLIFYREGVKSGYLRGYGEGQQDYRDYAEKHADYLFDQADDTDNN